MRRLGPHLAILIVLIVVDCFAQQSPDATLSGTALDTQGHYISGATLHLAASDDARPSRDARTDANGNFEFRGLASGTYALTARSATAEARLPSLFLNPGETKTVVLTLSERNVAPAANKPEFFDPPSFTVSGVTDTTSLGGHGSDAVVRTRDGLSKETSSLSSRPTAPATPEILESLRRQLQHDPQNAGLHHQLADAEESAGDPLTAAHEYERASELDGSEPNLFDWGAELLLHHAPGPAREVFARGSGLFPDSARMLLGWGAAEFASGANDQAIGKICAASDLYPEAPTPYLFLGKMMGSNAAASAQAIAHLRRFAERHPDDAQANYYYALALSKERAADPDQLKALLNNAIRLAPHWAEPHLRMGVIHAEEKDFAAAVSEFQAAIASDPQMPEPHFRLAQVYRRLGKPEQAAAELKRYDQATKESEQIRDRQRHEIRQFVYELRGSPTVK